ncbi:hypothetical protein ACFSZS_21480 [Seohaeicola zhoushanensis]
MVNRTTKEPQFAAGVAKRADFGHRMATDLVQDGSGFVFANIGSERGSSVA